MIIFRQLKPRDVHAHLRHFVQSGMASHGAKIVIAPVNVEIPIVRQIYKTKADCIGLLIRTSSVGREPLERIARLLESDGQSLKLRKSAKLKLLSQCTAFWPISEATYPAQAVDVLRKLCGALDQTWPTDIGIQYQDTHVSGLLPGVPDRGRAGNLGYALGRRLGRILGGS